MKRVKLAIRDSDPDMTWTPWGPFPVARSHVVANDPGESIPALPPIPPVVARGYRVTEFLRRHYFAVGAINRGRALSDFLRRGFSG